MRLAILIFLALLFYGPCSKKRPQPIPIPRPSPIQTPTPQETPLPVPSPVTSATPFPTPEISVSKYIPPRPAGTMATIATSEGLSAAIQAAQDDPAIASVHVTKGGSWTEPFILRKYTTFDPATYACDATPATTPAFLARLPKAEADVLRGIPLSDYGCVLVADGVYVGGTWRFPQAALDIMRETGDPVERATRLAAVPIGEGTTILEPTFNRFSGGLPAPSVEVFQALGDAGFSHTGKARKITIQGFRIEGRQQMYDGGVRSTVLLGNCETCAVLDVALVDTASIGVTAGGSAQEFRLVDGTVNKDNFSRDIVFTRILTSGVAGANIATINTEEAWVFENYVRRPGHHEPKFGGGVCGYDHETNSPVDHTGKLWIYNNFYDYEDAHQDSAGNAICVQDPYVGQKQTINEVFVVNNTIVGGRLDGARRFMSNGIFLNGLNTLTAAVNHIFRTGQNAMQIYNVQNGLIQDNVFDSTGGGGNPSFWSQGMRNTVVRRNPFFKRDIPINMEAGFLEKCGTGNTYVDNFIPEIGTNHEPTRVCP